MIEEAYCSFALAKLLKEKGFKALTKMVYRNPNNPFIHNKKEELIPNHDYIKEGDMCEILAPTHQMAMKFLREKGWVICVIPLAFYFGEKVSSWGYNIWASDNLEIDEDNTPKFTTYEEACEAAIKYCLENLI